MTNSFTSVTQEVENNKVEHTGAILTLSLLHRHCSSSGSLKSIKVLPLVFNKIRI